MQKQNIDMIQICHQSLKNGFIIETVLSGQEHLSSQIMMLMLSSSGSLCSSAAQVKGLVTD